MSTEPKSPTGDTENEGSKGSTIPADGDGIGVGAGGEANTFEPEEDPETAGTADVPDSKAPAGPAEEKDRQEPDDRGLTTDTSPSD